MGDNIKISLDDNAKKVAIIFAGVIIWVSGVILFMRLFKK